MTAKNCSGCSIEFTCAECLEQSIIQRIRQSTQDLCLAEKLVLAAPYADGDKLVEDIDFTQEDGNYIFSAWYHLKRGSCCGSGCRNCPYDQVKPGSCL